jgi:hypothetical protein
LPVNCVEVANFGQKTQQRTVLAGAYRSTTTGVPPLTGR